MDNIDFLTWIAKGFNPYTGEKFSDNDLLQSPQVSSRLKELAEELSEDRTEERLVGRNAIEIIYPYTTIQPFAKAISYAIYNALTIINIQTKILNYLLDEEKLEFRYASSKSERMSKFATEEGEKIGITNAIITDPYGKKEHKIYYSPAAQIYIIDRLPKILKN